MLVIKRKTKIWICALSSIVLVCIAGLAAWMLLYGGSSAKHFTRSEPRGRFAELIQPDTPYHVKRVVDGDTLVADVAGHEVTLRLIGIDTPEVVDRRKPVQCFGKEASEEGKRLLADKDVLIEKDPSKSDYDLYGRTLAYIKLPDGLFYNRYMIEHGFAREYTYSHEPYRYRNDFVSAQQKARSDKVGLWNPAACNGRQDAI
ncbi:MAG: Micrococcal nuclease [Candidatus Taylorbacteria bacterium]|nr:Micrococcal nuclease [Candidatus Taylorbacteria bacterium]